MIHTRRRLARQLDESFRRVLPTQCEAVFVSRGSASPRCSRSIVRPGADLRQPACGRRRGSFLLSFLQRIHCVVVVGDCEIGTICVNFFSSVVDDIGPPPAGVASQLAGRRRASACRGAARRAAREGAALVS